MSSSFNTAIIIQQYVNHGFNNFIPPPITKPNQDPLSLVLDVIVIFTSIPLARIEIFFGDSRKHSYYSDQTVLRLLQTIAKLTGFYLFSYVVYKL